MITIGKYIKVKIKMRKNIVKIIVFFLNLAIITTGVFYLKEKDDKKKEEKKAQEKSNMKELATFNIEKTQEVLEMVKQEKENYISSNSGKIVIEQETTVKKTIPAVTKVIIEEKKVPSTTTKTS